MKMYVYDNDDQIVAIVTGEDNEDCERRADDAGYSDNYGYSYTDATLTETMDTITI
jgi:hypothetical protein